MQVVGGTDDLNARPTARGRLGSNTFTDKLRCDRRRRITDGVEVVPAFERSDDSARRDRGGERPDQISHVGRGIAQVGDWVSPVAVEAGRDQQPRCPVGLDGRNDDVVDCSPSNVAGRAGREWHIDGSADRATAPPLVEHSCAGVQGRLVDRRKQHSRVVVEDVLGAVAVMRVDVNDRHPLTCIGERRGSDRNRVEQTEPHGVGGGRMVARWANDAEGAVVLVRFLQTLHRREHRPCGQARSEQTSCAHHRVRVESTTTIGVDSNDVIEEGTVMHETDLVVGHEPRQPSVNSIDDPRFGHAGHRRTQPIRTFRVRRPCRVLEAPFVTHQQQHPAERTPRT